MTSQLQEIPAILVSVGQLDKQLLNQMFWGIEEEGIPCKSIEKDISEIRQEAHNAASLSPLGVGVACDKQQVVVHSRNLAAETPLFELALNNNSKDESLDTQLRNLGSNAARLVKGLPFKPL